MGRAHEVRKAAMAKTAAAKTKVYSKFGKEILIAAKGGVPDPEMNLVLRRVIERAKKAQVPADIIKRAIDRAKSGTSEDYSAQTYEAFGPGAATLIIECLTDNVNRTVSDVRSALTKNQCKMGVTGSVSHGYNYVSIVSCKGVSEDQVLEVLLMADLNIKSVESVDDEVEIYGEVTDLYNIKTALEEAYPDIQIGTEELSYVPINEEYTSLEGDDRMYFERLLTMLEELDDVQEVYHNVEL